MRKKSAPAGKKSNVPRVVSYPASPAPAPPPPRDPRPRGGPRAAGDEPRGEREEAAENAHDQNPVEDLQRALDAPPHEKHRHAREKRPDADPVDRARLGRARDPLRVQEEDRPGRRPRPRRPPPPQPIKPPLTPPPQPRIH